MNDNRTALAAAVAGGYLLGRTRKAGLALAVGSYLAGRRLGLSPGRVLSQGLGRLQQAPQLQELTEQVRGELLTAGRAAFTAAANRRLTGLADTLRDRTDALTGASRGGDEEDYDDTEYYDDGYSDDDSDGYGYEDENGYPQEEDGHHEEEDGYPEEEDEADEEDDEPVPAPPRKAARKAADNPAGNAPPRKAAPGRMAKEAPAKKAPAKKTAAPAKRTTGRPGAEGRG